MAQTILITGTSSGIGKSTALKFAEQGWRVIATQRNPEEEKDLSAFSNVELMALDVTSLENVETLFNHIEKKYGKLDVVVNNAGFGVDGVFEAMSDEVIEKEFNSMCLS